MRLLESSLLDQIECLDFNYSLFEDHSCLGELLASPKLSNLKRLSLPFFGDQQNPDSESAIKKLETNCGLGKIEAFVVSDGELPPSTIVALLEAIRNNPALVNLRTIGAFDTTVRLPSDYLIEFRQCAHLKKFKTEDIRRLFRN